MKAPLLLLAALATTPASGLGIGLDVLPEAFAFAARRAGSYGALRLVSCDDTTCRWDAGSRVGLSARLSGYGLDIDRIEASLTPDPADPRTTSVDRFEGACFGIVGLAAPSASYEERQLIARSIARLPADGAVRKSVKAVRGIEFYGRRASGAAETMRCGVVTTAARTREP